MNSVLQKEFLKFIKMLKDNDCLGHLILIGSWAEYVYSNSGYLKNYLPNIRTLDIDFLIRNLNKPSIKKDLPTIAKRQGYFVDHDYITGATKILSTSQLEIEFLINQRGKGDIGVLNTNMGVNAQALRHMSIILNNTLVLNLFGIDICVPCPEAYVLHKIIINKERGCKKEKDRESILILLPYMDDTKISEITKQLSKKENRIVEKFFLEN